MTYLFNPEHDLALANSSPNYTPPASASRMAEELAVLPVWYAAEETVVADGRSQADGGSLSRMGKGKETQGQTEGETVIAEGEINRFFLDTVKKILPVRATLIPFSDITSHPYRKIIPWGWNPALRKKLISYGAHERELPKPEELACLRDYSNRKHAGRILHELQTEKKGFSGTSHFFESTDELYTWLQSTPGDKVLKMPLSGSGKGLIWILGAITDKQRDWCRRIVKEQGGVVAEPVLPKVQDFAMEFCLHGGEARFAGYSLFSAAASGAYTGNVLLSDARIEGKLSSYLPAESFHWLRNALKEKLSRYFPLYNGYAGVDMMICETSGGYSIQPCVEINMRMNMGMAARIFHDRFLPVGAEGKWVIDYFAKPGSALSFHEKAQREFPISVKNGKICSGYLSLTPVTQTTRYIAYVTVF